MALEKFGSIVAFRNNEGHPLAFHIENLELAKISEEAFLFMKSPKYSSAIDGEKCIESELSNWSHSDSLAPDLMPKNTSKKKDQLLINNTQVCNLKCVYCAAGGDGTYGDPVIKISIEKTFPQIEFFLKKLSRGDEFRINFLGGEPLLQPEIIEAIFDFAQDHAIQRGINLKFVITTNGTQINELVLKMLKKIKAFVNVSIDGPEVVNDKMRPQRNGESVTAKVIAGILKLVEQKRELGGVGLTAVFSELHTDVLETYEFFRNFSVDWYEFNFSHTEKSIKASSQFAESLSDVMEQAWEIGGEKELLKIRSVNFFFQRMDQRQKVSNFCGIHQNLLVIDARNQFYACPWDVGNKAKMIDKTEILGENRTPELIETKIPCQTCWMRNLCGGGCEFIHNNSEGFDENFCLRMNSLIKDTFVYYERARRI